MLIRHKVNYENSLNNLKSKMTAGHDLIYDQAPNPPTTGARVILPRFHYFPVPNHDFSNQFDDSEQLLAISVVWSVPPDNYTVQDYPRNAPYSPPRQSFVKAPPVNKLSAYRLLITDQESTLSPVIGLIHGLEASIDEARPKTTTDEDGPLTYQEVIERELRASTDTRLLIAGQALLDLKRPRPIYDAWHKATFSPHMIGGAIVSRQTDGTYAERAFISDATGNAISSILSDLQAECNGNQYWSHDPRQISINASMRSMPYRSNTEKFRQYSISLGLATLAMAMHAANESTLFVTSEQAVQTELNDVIAGSMN
jgi:hypothetical protein